MLAVTRRQDCREPGDLPVLSFTAQLERNMSENGSWMPSRPQIKLRVAAILYRGIESFVRNTCANNRFSCKRVYIARIGTLNKTRVNKASICRRVSFA